MLQQLCRQCPPLCGTIRLQATRQAASRSQPRKTFESSAKLSLLLRCQKQVQSKRGKPRQSGPRSADLEALFCAGLVNTSGRLSDPAMPAASLRSRHQILEDSAKKLKERAAAVVETRREASRKRDVVRSKNIASNKMSTEKIRSRESPGIGA